MNTSILSFSLVSTWISIYWFSGDGPAATARTYYEVEQMGREETTANPQKRASTVPAGASFFPKDIMTGPLS